VSYPFFTALTPILLVGSVEAVAFVMLEPTLFATISETTDARHRGRAMGVGGLFQFGGSAAGAAVLGSLYGLGDALPFRGGAALCLSSAVLCGLALPLKRGAPEPATLMASADLEVRA
jgi:MFS family permease